MQKRGKGRIARCSDYDMMSSNSCRLNSQRSRKKGGPSLPMAPMLLGELLLHSGPVKVGA